MAPTSKSRQKRRKCCFFPGGCCFGSFPSEHDSNTEKKMLNVDDGKLVKFGSGKKLARWGKTVPVIDTTLKKVSNSSEEISVVVESEDHKVPVPLPDHKVIANKDTDVEKSKSGETPGRVISPVKQPEGQKKESKLAWSDPVTKLSHSVSMPLLQRKTDKVTAAIVNGGEIKAGEFDPIVGALILTVTLIVMLLWGKVSAILSTAIWFYIVPRVMRPTPNVVKNHVGHKNGMKNVASENDLGSLEDKRKVVLQGFLERNRHF